MDVLILGGSSFLGLHLTRVLQEEGHQVIWLNRGRSPVPIRIEVPLIRADRNKPLTLAKMLADVTCDIIIDLSGYRPAQVVPVLEAFRDRGLSHYIFCSSVAVYQGFSGWMNSDFSPWDNYFQIPVTEEHPLRPSHSYGWHKLKCEELLLEAYVQSGFPVTILRLPPVFGPWDYKCREFFYIRQMQELRAVLLLEGGHNLIHNLYVADFAKVCADLIGRPESYGLVFNVAPREPITLRRYVALMAEAFEFEIQFIDVSMVEAQHWISGNAYRHWPYCYPYHFILDTRKLKSIVPLPGSLRESMLKTVRWFVDVGVDWLERRVDLMRRVNDSSIGLYDIRPTTEELVRYKRLLEVLT
jgi:nucleoside-diphosphate-sugar epimerase